MKRFPTLVLAAAFLLVPCLAIGQQSPPPSGEAHVRQVVFDTWPAGARVELLQGDTPRDLGRSGTPIMFDNAMVGYNRSTYFIVRFTLNDMKREEKIDNNYFRYNDRWPEKGKPALVLAETFSQRFLYTVGMPAWVAGLILAGLVAGAGAVLSRRLRARGGEGAPAAGGATGGEALPTGPTFGPYQAVRMLGEGGMGQVFEARKDDALPGSPTVAIKTIRPGVTTPDDMMRLKREVHILQKLQHNGIVRLIDWSLDEPPLYIVMELVRGTTLREQMPSEGMPLARFLELYPPILQAVSHAHEKGIVHRDLKPENVMVTEGGQIKVMDFGLSVGNTKSIAAMRVTHSGDVLGTPAYVAPEQIQGSATQASDQYALGIMGYEMLSGKGPLGDSREMLEMLMAHLTMDPVPLRERAPQVSEALEAVLMRMLAKEPEERFDSLDSALEAVLEAGLTAR